MSINLTISLISDLRLRSYIFNDSYLHVNIVAYRNYNLNFLGGHLFFQLAPENPYSEKESDNNRGPRGRNIRR